MKNKRKQVRGRITRSIKRLSEGVSKGDLRRFFEGTNLRRFGKEVARELHSQLYDLPDVDNNVLDKWEDDQTNDVYGIEEIVEEYMRGASKSSGEASSGKRQKNVPQSASKQRLPESTPQASSSQTTTPEVRLHCNKKKLKKFRCLPAIRTVL